MLTRIDLIVETEGLTAGNAAMRFEYAIALEHRKKPDSAATDPLGVTIDSTIVERAKTASRVWRKYRVRATVQVVSDGHADAITKLEERLNRDDYGFDLVSMKAETVATPIG